MKIHAAVTSALDEAMIVEDVHVDEPGPGEVLVCVVAGGLCRRAVWSSIGRRVRRTNACGKRQWSSAGVGRLDAP